MQNRSKYLGWICVVLGVSGVLGACTKARKASPSASSKPAVSVSPAKVQALAKAPKPPATATSKGAIGGGDAMLSTVNAPGDNDSYWVEEIDIDGDGSVEDTEFLWDDEDKVLFAYAETDVPCTGGGTEVAALLIGVNADGNSRGRPAGSGFYAVYLDATECDAAAAGLYGCQFDAKGNVIAWGEAVLDEDTDTVVIAGSGAK